MDPNFKKHLHFLKLLSISYLSSWRNLFSILYDPVDLFFLNCTLWLMNIFSSTIFVSVHLTFIPSEKVSFGTYICPMISTLRSKKFIFYTGFLSFSTHCPDVFFAQIPVLKNYFVVLTFYQVLFCIFYHLISHVYEQEF